MFGLITLIVHIIDYNYIFPGLTPSWAVYLKWLGTQKMEP